MTMDSDNNKLIKVLVVEDNPLAAKMARISLEGKGCVVECAVNGKEAIEKLDASFNFVLLDLGLPDIDGFEVAKIIRSGNTVFATIPIVVLTAHEEEREKVDFAKELGINGFLSKPLLPPMCDLLLNKFVFSEIEKDYFLQWEKKDIA